MANKNGIISKVKGLYKDKEEELVEEQAISELDVYPKLLSIVTGQEESKIEEVMSNFKEVDYVVNTKVDKIHFNKCILTIEGTAGFSDFPVSDKDEIEKNIILVNESNEEKEYIVGTSIKEDDFNYFVSEIDFSKLNNGKVISPGTYSLLLEVRQYIKGSWIVKRNNLQQINQEIYSGTAESFSPKSNKKFKVTIHSDHNTKDMTVVIKKLSDINPLLTQDLDTGDGLLLRRAKQSFFKLMYKISCMRKVKENKISFLSDSRIDVSGNFEFIFEEIQKHQTIFNDVDFYLKESIRTPKTFGELRKLAKAIATSQYIILDDFYPLIYPLVIREKSELIQVWHAVGAFKTFGYSRLGMPGGPSFDSINHKNYTKVIVSSQNIADKYAEGFGVPIENVIPLGVARTDMFFDESKKSEIISNLKNEFDFIGNKKVILFAPTFRGNGQQSAHYPFQMLDMKYLFEELSDEYIFLFKMHPFTQNKVDIPYIYSEFFYDVSEYREINDLLLVTDHLITDYSSVCFEYGLLRKPMTFFSPDLDEYISSRDFYYDYESFIPGNFAKSNSELIASIKQENIENKRYNQFIEYFFDEFDGKASERFVSELLTNFEQYNIDEDEEAIVSIDGKYMPRFGSKIVQK